MDNRQWKRLDVIVDKLKANYEGTIRGTQPMLKAAMRVAYAKALSDLAQTVIDEQMDLLIPEAKPTGDSVQETSTP